jgi:4-amino-4-deoxy-L-arabinose transferase-like glycosyltransferase
MPAAIVLLAAGLAVTWRAPRTDRTRAAFLLWGGWLLVTGLTFSFMQGIFHAYYTVALAPAIGALVGMGTTVLWGRRRIRAAAVALAGTLILTVGWSATLLDRAPDWQPWLRTAVLVAGLGAAILLLLAGRLSTVVGGLVAAVGLTAALAAPAAYAVETAATPHGRGDPVGRAGRRRRSGLRGRRRAGWRSTSCSRRNGHASRRPAAGWR